MTDHENVAAAVAGAVGQARLDAGVNITALLMDMDRADSVDSRRFFMCWQLTRVLAPTLAEKVPAAVARKVVKAHQVAQPRCAPPDRGVIWWLSAMLVSNAGNWYSTRHDYLSRNGEPRVTDSCVLPHSGPGPDFGRAPGYPHLNDDDLVAALTSNSGLSRSPRRSRPFQPLVTTP